MYRYSLLVEPKLQREPGDYLLRRLLIPVGLRSKCPPLENLSLIF